MEIEVVAHLLLRLVEPQAGRTSLMVPCYLLTSVFSRNPLLSSIRGCQNLPLVHLAQGMEPAHPTPRGKHHHL